MEADGFRFVQVSDAAGGGVYVSKDGLVRGRIIVDNEKVLVGKQAVSLARIVYAAFKCDGDFSKVPPRVFHIDCNPKNNSIENLSSKRTKIARPREGGGGKSKQAYGSSVFRIFYSAVVFDDGRVIVDGKTYSGKEKVELKELGRSVPAVFLTAQCWVPLRATFWDELRSLGFEVDVEWTIVSDFIELRHIDASKLDDHSSMNLQWDYTLLNEALLLRRPPTEERLLRIVADFPDGTSREFSSKTEAAVALKIPFRLAKYALRSTPLASSSSFPWKVSSGPISGGGGSGALTSFVRVRSHRV